MKAWGDLPGRGRGPSAAGRPRQAIDEAGIDLDPVPYGHHRHGDEVHADDHVHPHHHSEPGETPYTGIVGAGAVGTALGRRPEPGRLADPRGRQPRRRPPGAVHGARRGGARVRRAAGPRRGGRADHPGRARRRDRAARRLASGMYGGQAMVHTSGALGAEVLAPAMAAGTQIGAFHPLVAFADTERAIAALHGATVAIEGDDQLAALLSEMAEADRRDGRPAGARLEGGLPRGRRAGCRGLRRPARRDRGARRGRRPRRGRRRWRSTGR